MESNEMVEISREQFEQAWSERYPVHCEASLIRSKVEPDSYVNTRTKDAWWAWQVALERRELIRSSIEAMSLKVKP